MRVWVPPRGVAKWGGRVFQLDCSVDSFSISGGFQMLFVLVGLLVVGGLVWYGDLVQRREKREHGAQQQQLVAQQQRLVSGLVVPAIVEQVKAQLEEEMGERMGDAIADVQDAILASLSEVIRESVRQDVSAPVVPPVSDVGEGASVEPSRRLSWDSDRGAWTDGVNLFGEVVLTPRGVRPGV